MLKKDLAKKIAEECKVSVYRAGKVLDCLEDTVLSETVKDGTVFCGKLRFKLKHTKERAGRNPNTGEVITVPAKSYVALRRRVG